MHNFIQQSLNSGSAQFQILLAACRRFAMVRVSMAPGGNEAKRHPSVNHTTKTKKQNKTIHHHNSQSSPTVAMVSYRESTELIRKICATFGYTEKSQSLDILHAETAMSLWWWYGVMIDDEYTCFQFCKQVFLCIDSLNLSFCSKVTKHNVTQISNKNASHYK